MSPKYRVGIFIVVLISLACIPLVAVMSRQPALQSFDKVEGPDVISKLAGAPDTDWREYAQGEPSRVAIFLTNEESAWAGLVVGMKSIGIPFVITDDVDAAVRHDVVLAYPAISGRLLDASQIDTLRAHVDAGGTLIATQILGGGMQDLFGFNGIREVRAHYEIRFTEDEPTLAFINHPRERVTRIGNPERPDDFIGVQEFQQPENVLARYEDGSAALISNSLPGGGQLYGVGLDLGFFILKALNDRDNGAHRDYGNGYEPSVDVWLRWLKATYLQHEDDAAILSTVPEGRDLVMIASFDIDFVDSMDNLEPYREVLASHDVPGTYFIQTKYFSDYADQGFFNDGTIDTLREIASSGSEIASHSVAHSDMFATLPMGSGEETYPSYQPRVVAQQDTRNATVLGELRVSRFLLETVTGTKPVSFRPGYLATPDALPQALTATGYSYTSSVTAGNVLSHLPYQLTYNRNYSNLTNTFQFPIAIEDEIPPTMDQRLDAALALADELSEYGGLFLMLIHPDVLDEKLDFLERVLPKLSDRAWSGTLAEYGAWWEMRNTVQLDIEREDGAAVLRLSAASPMRSLTINLPSGLEPAEGREGLDWTNNLLIIDTGRTEEDIPLRQRPSSAGE